MIGREEEEWIDQYPGIEAYSEMDADELYDQTIMIPIMEAMAGLSDGKKSEEEILQDLLYFDTQIFPTRLKIPVFEYSLHQLMGTTKVKECYLYKDRPFCPNEALYIERRFDNVQSKLHLVQEVDFGDLVKTTHATTIFVADPSFVFDYALHQLTEEEQVGKLFVILNSIYTMDTIVQEDGSVDFKYRDDFIEKMKEINDNEDIPFAVAAMFNPQLER